MRVKDIMQTEVTTLRLEDSLDLADDVMNLGRVRHLPVVAGDRRLVGLLTQRDLLKASVASVLELRHAVKHDWLKVIPVKLVMTNEVLTIHPDEPLREAVELMIARKFG